MTDKRYSILAAILSVAALAGLWTLSLNKKVNAAAEGSITGTVKLSGTPPHMRGIDMSKDPYCSKAHASDPAKMETVVVGKDQGLQNVVLYISQGLSAADASQKQSTTPVFDQKGCMYTPHVMAVDAGQEFKVTTSDQTSHNIHPQPNPMTGNIPWNRSQPPGAPPIVQTWKAEEIAIPVKCNIHPWMHGWHVVVKGPYATTDENGSYTIHGVSPGSYTVTAWQEELGTQTAKLTVAAGAPAKADFTFKAK
jgi:plastocyanin